MRACNCARASPFQSRTREGGDDPDDMRRFLNDPVSIHAPAWGATSSSGWRRPGQHPCFNPRTRVGCDPKNPYEIVKELVFQSTHPRGVRPTHVLSNVAQERVSIHAPAWGATHKILRS